MSTQSTPATQDTLFARDIPGWESWVIEHACRDADYMRRAGSFAYSPTDPRWQRTPDKLFKETRDYWAAVKERLCTLFAGWELYQDADTEEDKPFGWFWFTPSLELSVYRLEISLLHYDHWYVSLWSRKHHRSQVEQGKDLIQLLQRLEDLPNASKIAKGTVAPKQPRRR